MGERGGFEESENLRLMNMVFRHYVAFIRKEVPQDGEAWVLFNDEKVVKAEGDVDEMKKFAYVYFFGRV